MVLNDLGQGIRDALQKFNHANSVEEKDFSRLLVNISKVLLYSDVNVHLVDKLRKNIMGCVDLKKLNSGANKKRIIQKAIFNELSALVDPHNVAQYSPKKGNLNIVMFVGLQGSGKTTTCVKYGCYYKKRGFKVGLVCSDTFRAGALDQLKQNAEKVGIPYYGNYSETDPVSIAINGIERFQGEKFDLVIVDTSGRHKQEEELFLEMKQIHNAVSVDHVVLIMDSSIGQAAKSQAKAFQDSVDIGSIIITKMDGHGKGGGALSAVAATGSPIGFIGTGEGMYDLEKFNAKSFISKLLGIGDLHGLIETVTSGFAGDEKGLEKVENMSKKILQGEFTLRDMQDHFQMVMNMGSMTNILSMLPGVTPDVLKSLNAGQDADQKTKRFMVMLDSMTSKELDGDGKIFRKESNRLERVAIGSGSSVLEVSDLLDQYKKVSSVVKKMGGNKELLSDMFGAADGNSGPSQLSKMTKHLSSMMSNNSLFSGRGSDHLKNMLKQMQDTCYDLD